MGSVDEFLNRYNNQYMRDRPTATMGSTFWPMENQKMERWTSLSEVDSSKRNSFSGTWRSSYCCDRLQVSADGRTEVFDKGSGRTNGRVYYTWDGVAIWYDTDGDWCFGYIEFLGSSKCLAYAHQDYTCPSTIGRTWKYCEDRNWKCSDYERYTSMFTSCA